MKPRKSSLVSALLVSGAFAARAAAPLNGPVTAFVFDGHAHAVRPVNGLPGSSLLGKPLDLHFAVRSASFARTGRMALLINDKDGSLLLARNLTAAQAEVIPLEGAMNAPDLMAWNDSGSAAIVGSAQSGQVQLISGLPDHLRVGKAAGNVPFATVLGLSPDASTAVIGTSDGLHGTVHVADAQSPDRVSAVLPVSRMPVAVEFLNGGRDAAVADQEAGEIWLIQGLKTSPSAFVAASSKDGLRQPSCLQKSSNGRDLLIADAGTRSLFVLDLTNLATSRGVTFATTPNRCQADSKGGVLILNNAASDPILLVDLGREHAAYFVPANR
jgi:hypothetical protein